jgi:hypothetical protein
MLKNSLRFALPVVAVFALLALSIHPQPSEAKGRPAAVPIVCGQTVYGHTASGGAPTISCPNDGLPAFDNTCHVYTDRDVCPQDGLPLIYGRSVLSF